MLISVLTYALYSPVRSIIDFFADFSQNFSLLVLKNSITISITKMGIVKTVTLKKPFLFRADFIHDFNRDFVHSGTWLADFNHDFKHDFNHENRHSGTGYIEIAVFVPCRFQSRFSAQWNTP